VQIEPRRRYTAGEHTTTAIAIPVRPAEDATWIYSVKAAAWLGLDAADLADTSLVIDLWIEVSDDPAGLVGWRRVVTCGSWRGGRLNRAGGPRVPRVGVSAAAWKNTLRFARVGWQQSRTAFASVQGELTNITYDKRTARSVAIDSGSAAQGEAAGDTLTVSVVTAAGTDLLVIGVENYRGGLADVVSAVSATHNLDATTSLATTQHGASNDERSTILRRVAPDIGTFDVVITPVDPADSTELTAAILAFSGVDQTTPFGTAQTAAPDGVTSTTLTIVRGADDMVVSICGWYDQTVTVGGDLTQRVLNDNGASFQSIVLGTSVVDASIASTYSWAASENPGHIAVNINAAAGGAVIKNTHPWPLGMELGMGLRMPGSSG